MIFAVPFFGGSEAVRKECKWKALVFKQCPFLLVKSSCVLFLIVRCIRLASSKTFLQKTNRHVQSLLAILYEGGLQLKPVHPKEVLSDYPDSDVVERLNAVYICQLPQILSRHWGNYARSEGMTRVGLAGECGAPQRGI